MSNEMAILQEVDKCMKCNGCVTACKREWNLALPTSMTDPTLGQATVKTRQRLAIKSTRRGDMGPFMRFSCWHCPDPPCGNACPRKAITKQANGAVSVDNTLCEPTLCKAGTGPRPCEIGCQQGGYPKAKGAAYQTEPLPGVGVAKMNKCTLCWGRAGEDDPTKKNMLPTRATKNISGNYVSTMPLSTGALPDNGSIAELAHEPACVSSCPAKAMKWDTKKNILAYLRDPANGYILPNLTENWNGNGSVYWASKKGLIAPPKADPFIEDHITPMVSSMVSGSGKLMVPALLLGGFAVVSMRRAKVQAEANDLSVREV